MPALSGFLYKLKTPNTQSVAEQATIPAISAFSDITGIQNTSLSGSASEVEITNKSSGENRELLNKRGVLSLDVSFDGIAQDSQLHKDLQSTFLRQQLRWFSVEREDGRRFIARFKITSYNTSASHDSAQTFDVSLLSSGVVYIRDSSGFHYDTGKDRITAFASLVNPFSYFLFFSPSYFGSQIPARGSDRVARMRSIVTNLSAPAGANAISGNPTTDIHLSGPSIMPATQQRITFALNTSQYKGFSRAGNYLVTGATGQLSPDIANLLELVANPANVFATVAPANKAWLTEGVEMTIGTNKYHFGEYDDTHNRAKLLDANGNEVRGDSIDIVRSGQKWSDATARDLLRFQWQVKNRFRFNIILIQKSLLAGKILQVLDALDGDITDKLTYVGDKTDTLGDVYSAYFIDIVLGDGEDIDIKVQIGD